MAKISKKIMLLAAVLFCAVFLADISAAPNKKTSPQIEKQVENPHENSRILVEAFVVEVSLDTLYKSGVSPIGQKPNSVSIKNILYCLKDKENGKVTAGAKVAVKNREEGKTETREKTYVKREQQVVIHGKPTTRRTRDNYTSGIDFSIRAIVKSENKIVVSFKFNQSGLVFLKNDAVPNTFDRQWENTVSLEAGKPTIVGAIQNEDTAVFLILVADIYKS